MYKLRPNRKIAKYGLLFLETPSVYGWLYQLFCLTEIWHWIGKVREGIGDTEKKVAMRRLE